MVWSQDKNNGRYTLIYIMYDPEFLIRRTLQKPNREKRLDDLVCKKICWGHTRNLPLELADELGLRLTESYKKAGVDCPENWVDLKFKEKFNTRNKLLDQMECTHEITLDTIPMSTILQS